ncbi:MAG: nicotinate-nucleotide adenylyltransferase [Lachnospiraceae bacterium]|nr:nicotinate-nucleotide adenylyltransferase [Lachnospiraceae bacterium]
MSKMKIGILGGTFDPIHKGHISLAENAYKQFGLDKILVMPSGNPPHKTDRGITEAVHRNRMIELAIKDKVYMELSLFEQERTGYIYTAETLILLKEANTDCEYYFIVGGDSLASMGKWRTPETIFANAIILAATREGVDKASVLALIDDYKHKYNATIYPLDIPDIRISSEMIRSCVNEGKNIKELIPNQVWNYICDNKLYN